MPQVPLVVIRVECYASGLPGQIFVQVISEGSVKLSDDEVVNILKQACESQTRPDPDPQRPADT